jgi:glutamyl-tRNA synthetase
VTTVRTRFAPSPTGPLHIGSARTALFTWLLARHYGGQFVLRVEDTDQKRFVEGALEQVMSGLRWLGLEWDEGPDKGGPYGPYTQSERLDLYQKWANWLVEHDHAYRAYDSSEELADIAEERKAKGLSGYDGRHRNLTPQQEQRYIDEGRKPVIRFKAPHKGKTVTEDLVRGKVEFDNSVMQDMVLLKSDGFPTYHLAHIIDDQFMEISHVTRSIEWLPSLPLHIHLWQAFGWDIPVYAHLPVILNPSGKGKLSKRHTAYQEGKQKVLVLVQEYVEAGYYAPAVVNFLTNVGWNFGDEREVFDVEEAITRFDGSGINPANSVFPIEKLDWLNGVYIREKMNDDELAEHLRAVLQKAGYTVDEKILRQVIPLVKTRIKSFKDVIEMAGFFFCDDFHPPITDDLIQKKMDAAGTRQLLEESLPVLEAVDETAWDTDHIHSVAEGLVDKLQLKRGQVFGAMRVAVTGQRISTPTFESMEIIGKPESLRRIRTAINILES